ncbi:MAG: hypothetical protein ABIT01_13455 [Thermoanaerobaculia bacterium]
MKKILLVLVVIVLAAKFGNIAIAPFLKKGVSAAGDLRYQDSARTRVKTILDGMKQSGEALELPLQTAICQWGKGVGFIGDKDELGKVWADFDVWRREKGFDRKISGYSVEDAKMDDGASEPTAIVFCTIEGQRLKMRVVKGKPVSWINY